MEQSTARANALERVVRVLVADKDRLSHDLIARTIRQNYRAGRFHSVASAVSAIRAAESSSFDVAFVDAGLDQANMANVVSELRRVAPETPICVMRPRATEPKPDAGARLGAAQVLDKPLRADAILNVTAKLLAPRRDD